MYTRQKYKDHDVSSWHALPDPIGTKKYDGGHYFLEIQSDGSMKYYSRRQSVRGHYPERSEKLPHLSDKKLPQYAGHVFSVELIHSGTSKYNKESHPAVSGILNSLPERAIQTQKDTGPVRAVLLDVINPPLPTYNHKLNYMKDFETAFGRPHVLFVPEVARGAPAIVKLINKTKEEGHEGIIVASGTTPETNNPRVKIKHFDTYNLRIVKVIQEVDKNGNPKPQMGALDLADATGRVVATVGTGFDRAMRQEVWQNQREWIGRLIQIKTMGWGSEGGKLRMPVYNGDADGDLDTVK